MYKPLEPSSMHSLCMISTYLVCSSGKMNNQQYKIKGNYVCIRKLTRDNKRHTSFANPKSASFTDPLASTNILPHLISLEDHKKNRKTSFNSKQKTITLPIEYNEKTTSNFKHFHSWPCRISRIIRICQ